MARGADDPRQWRMRSRALRATRVVLDLCLLGIALGIAYLLRFDGMPPPRAVAQLVAVLPAVVLGQYLALMFFGVPRVLWRYTSLDDVGHIVSACYVSSATLGILRTLGPRLDVAGFAAEITSVPYGVIAINFVTSVMALTSIRVARRILVERRGTQRRSVAGSPQRTLLIGAGEAAAQVVRELRARPDLGMRPVGLLDDDKSTHGRVIHGVRVLGATGELEATANATHAEQVLITIAEAPGSLVRTITAQCEALKLPVKTIPALYEIVDGRLITSRIRPVQIEDLLRRDQVTIDLGRVGGEVRGASVLVTGAGGSIGSELCRQLLHFKPGRLVLFERAENALYSIHHELAPLVTDATDLVACIGDVTDAERVRQVLDQYQPRHVFHAAAHKHVPIMEANPSEAVKNNVFGTVVVVDACITAQVDRFLFISTDKAVNPTSVMGATKRLAERYVQAAAERGLRRFVSVRFGNVLGSSGSVVPLFQRQIAAGGPVTVTHPEMRRYFMTIPEACRLVLDASTMGEGGEVFVLDMGELVKIVDLAHDLIRLSGLRPHEDVTVDFIGARPGEKIYEELSLDTENTRPTHHDRILCWGSDADHGADLDALCELLGRAEQGDHGAVRAELRRLVPEFRPDSSAMPGLLTTPRVVQADEFAAAGLRRERPV